MTEQAEFQNLNSILFSMKFQKFKAGVLISQKDAYRMSWNITRYIIEFMKRIIPSSEFCLFSNLI